MSGTIRRGPLAGGFRAVVNHQRDRGWSSRRWRPPPGSPQSHVARRPGIRTAFRSRGIQVVIRVNDRVARMGWRWVVLSPLQCEEWILRKDSDSCLAAPLSAVRRPTLRAGGPRASQVRICGIVRGQRVASKRVIRFRRSPIALAKLDGGISAIDFARSRLRAISARGRMPSAAL